MSWLFSQALVAEYSAAICSDGAPSAPSNGNPTQQAYLSHGKTTAFSRLSRFGMTCKPLTDAHGEALLTSYLADFRARTSAPQGGAKASKASAAACGSTWPASSVKYCRDSSSWKTAHCLWEEDLPWSSVTLPTWGMTRNGFVYQHPTAARPISAIGAGLWATPSATDGMRGGRITENMTGISLAQHVNTPDRWPTPMASDGSKGGPNQRGSKGDLRLSSAVHLFPAHSAATLSMPARSASTGAQTVKAMEFPTATATMHKGWSKNHNRADTDDRIDYKIEREAMEAGTPGRLNPTWVEWLMGWPLGWTDLKPLAMARFREWQQQHSLCWPEMSDAA